MRKLLIALVLGLSTLAASAQTHVFPAEDTNNVFTGTNAFAQINNTLYVGTGTYTTPQLALTQACTLSGNNTVDVPVGIATGVNLATLTGCSTVNIVDERGVLPVFYQYTSPGVYTVVAQGSGGPGGPYTNLLINGTRDSSSYGGPIFGGITPNKTGCLDAAPTFAQGAQGITCAFVTWNSYGSSSQSITEGSVSTTVNDGIWDNHVDWANVSGGGDKIVDNVTVIANSGLVHAADQGNQLGSKYMGEQIGFPTFILASGTTGTITPTFTAAGTGCGGEFDFDACLPGVYNWLDNDSVGVITGSYTGPSVAFVGNGTSACNTISWLNVLPTSATFPITTVWGCAFNVNVNPATNPDTPVSEVISLAGGLGTFSVGDLVTVMGSNYIEKARITAVSGTSPTQTVTLPLTEPNTSIAIFKADSKIISFDANLAESGGYNKTAYVHCCSLTGSDEIYAVESAGHMSNTLPQTGSEPEIAAISCVINTPYTVGTLCFDGTNIQKVTTAGTTTGTLPTWNTSVPTTTALGGSTTDGAVFVNQGPVANFHVFPAARIVSVNDTNNIPTVVLGPNNVAWAAGNSVDALHYDAQNTTGTEETVAQEAPSNLNTGFLHGQREVIQGPPVGAGGVSASAYGHLVQFMAPCNPLTYTQCGGNIQEPSYGYAVTGYTQRGEDFQYAPLLAALVIENLQPNQTSMGICCGYGGGIQLSFEPGPQTLTVFPQSNPIVLGGSGNALSANNASITLGGSSYLNISNFINSNIGFRVNNAAPLNHCLIGNGTNYVDNPVCQYIPGGAAQVLVANGAGGAAASAGTSLDNAGNLSVQTLTANTGSGLSPINMFSSNTTATYMQQYNSSNGSPTYWYLGVAGSSGFTAVSANCWFLINTVSGSGSPSINACSNSITFSAPTTVPSLIVNGTGAPITMAETTTFSGVSGSTVFQDLSSNHRPQFNPNAAGWFNIPGVATAGTSAHLAVFTSNGIDLTDGGPVLSLTTTGTSGAATYISGVLNVPNYASGGGSGTVTAFSSGNLSPLFTTSVATSTTTPALSFSLSTQSANLLFAGPASGSAAAPTFRSLVVADIPTAIPIANIGTAGLSGTSPITISAGGAIGCSTCNTSSATVSSFSSASIASLFTAAVATATTTPALTWTLTSAVAGDVPNSTSSSAAAWTPTPILGIDGSVAGTQQYANGSASAHTIIGSAATTSNTVKWFATAPTTGDLTECITASTTCTMTDSGVLAANVLVATSHPSAGILRIAGSTQTATSAEISGDCTTSGSNAITCTKTNGTSLTGYATAAYVADTTITVGSGVAFSANTCSSYTGTGGTASTTTMTGLTSAMVLTHTATSDVHSVTGWSPASGGQLYFTSWPTSNTLNDYVCNATGSTITTGSSVTFNVGVK